MRTEILTLPAHWASALINGDFSGLDDSEAAALDAWQTAATAEGYGECLGVSEESAFYKYHDARAFVLACDCSDFTFKVTQ
jgi:hypothetical protein